jgi:hypothetical protein
VGTVGGNQSHAFKFYDKYSFFLFLTPYVFSQVSHPHIPIDKVAVIYFFEDSNIIYFNYFAPVNPQTKLPNS